MHTRLPFRWIVFAAPLVAASLLGVASGAGTGGFQARTWDVDVKVPAGAWRAGKTIDLVGGLKVAVQPGAFIEDAAFISSKQGQRWEIDGAFLRKVRIAGDLGTHLTAKDSVFEECSLDKNGGWFVAWWGTRWSYENCVFTKKFMRGDFGVARRSRRA